MKPFVWKESLSLCQCDCVLGLFFKKNGIQFTFCSEKECDFTYRFHVMLAFCLLHHINSMEKAIFWIAIFTPHPLRSTRVHIIKQWQPFVRLWNGCNTIYVTKKIYIFNLLIIVGGNIERCFSIFPQTNCHWQNSISHFEMAFILPNVYTLR